ncbi:MAG: hypothetical protein HY399_04390 [Elusimicrobia bacterium]|nr:hypothetical protein [Elusimicrobiota bacterium]
MHPPSVLFARDDDPKVLKPGTVARGENSPALDQAVVQTLQKLDRILDDIANPEGQKGLFGKNLNATLTNLRNLSATLNQLASESRPHLRSISQKLDRLLTKMDNGEGAIGALLTDPKIKEDIRQTVTNLKDATASAKDVLGRVNGFRVWWHYLNRYEPQAKASRGDVGVYIYPREGRYYYLGGANLGNPSDEPRALDYERKNLVDARLGWIVGPLEFYAGLIRSAGGIGFRYKPFYTIDILDRIVLLGEGYDFLRNRTIAGRRFDHAEYDAGGELILHRMLSVGIRVQDLQETKRTQYTVRVTFEDKDIAYLLGLITFCAAGTKGRSSSQ